MSFVTPTIVQTKKPAAKGKKTRDEVLVEKMELLASLRAMMDTIETEAKILEADVREVAYAHMVEAGIAAGKHPGNIEIHEGIGSAGFEVKARSVASAVLTEDAETLAQHGIKTEKVTQTPAYLAINPKYADNQDILGQLDAAAQELGLPEDLVIQTPEQSRTVVPHGSIDAVFALRDEGKAKVLLPLVSTCALSKVTVEDMAKAILIATEHLGPLFAAQAGQRKTFAAAKKERAA